MPTISINDLYSRPVKWEQGFNTTTADISGGKPVRLMSVVAVKYENAAVPSTQDVFLTIHNSTALTGDELIFPQGCTKLGPQGVLLDQGLSVGSSGGSIRRWVVTYIEVD